MKKMTKPAHMGKERIHLERIRTLEAQKKQIENEILAILDRLTNESKEFKEKQLEFVIIRDQIRELKKKVEYHMRCQMRGEKNEETTQMQ